MLRTPSTFLSRALALDALATGATALLLALGAGSLEPLLGLPAALMRWAGALLIPFVALVAFAATRKHLPTGLVWAIILCNAAWVAASVALLAGSWVHPTWLGAAFVIAQAIVVGLFAELQFVGLRRSTALA
jgi:hypothetical protein